MPRHRVPQADPLGDRRHQPHPLQGLYRRGDPQEGAGSILLPQPLVLRRPRGRDPEPRRLQAHHHWRALGGHGARQGRLHPCHRERLRAPRHAVLPRAQRQPAELHLPLPPMELHAVRRPAGRALPARRQAGRQGQRRHPGRLQDHRPRAHEAEGGRAWRRRVRVLRPRGRVAGRLSRPGDPGLLRPTVQRTSTEDPRLQPPAHPRQLEADAGEHQGSVPPRAAAHPVRHLRALAGRQQVASC